MEKQKSERWFPLFLLLLGISILWFILFKVILCYLNSYSEKVSIGYSSEAINALFSGLAFGAFLYTVYLQRKELALQRKELEQTREEVKIFADAREKSETALNAQIQLMNISAELNAYSILFKVYSEEAEQHSRTLSSATKKSAEKKLEYRNKIEEILKKLAK